MADDKQEPGKAFEEKIKEGAAHMNNAAAAIKTAESFPNKSHYEDGHIFNFPVSHYEARTEAAVKQSLLGGGNSEDQTNKDMVLIREGLAFHKTTFAKE